MNMHRAHFAAARRKLMKQPVPSFSREIASRGAGGQILVEYGLILLLIAIVVILMVKGLGMSTNNMYSKVNTSVTSAMQ